jgi:hypothetical protein
MGSARTTRTPSKEKRKQRGNRIFSLHPGSLRISSVGVLRAAATADGTVGEVDAEQRDDLELLGGTENGVSSNGVNLLKLFGKTFATVSDLISYCHLPLPI